MLTRATQIGEFYIMGPPVAPPMTPTSNFMDVMIYDEEGDKHVVVTFEEAFLATCIHGVPQQGPANNQVYPDIETNLTTEQWIEAAEKWEWLNKHGGNLEPEEFREHYAYCMGKLQNPPPDPNIVTNQGVDQISQNGMASPIYIVLVRPFIEHLMHSAILTVSGRDTGATLFGPADMQISANTQVKTIEGCLRSISTLCTAFFLFSFPTLKPHTSQSLHRPLQVRGHQATERFRDAGHCLPRLHCGEQRLLVCGQRGRRLPAS